MSADIVIVKESHKETIFKSCFNGNWILFKVISRKHIYIRVDDSFAKANGYASLQDFKNKEPEFKKAFDECVKGKDGFLWVLWNYGEYLGFKKATAN